MNGLEFKSNSNGKCHMVVDENFAEEILHACIAARVLGKYASDCRGQRIHSARRKFRFGNGRKKIFAVLSQAV